VSTGYHWIIETSSQTELIMVTVCSSMMEVGRITENPSPTPFPSDSLWSPILVYPPKKETILSQFHLFKKKIDRHILGLGFQSIWQNVLIC